MSVTDLLTDRLFTIAVIGFVLAFVACSLLRKIAPSLGLLDRPSDIKIHEQPVPRAGGIGIFLAFVISLFFARGNTGYLTVSSGALELPLAGVFLVGLIDDRFSIRPLYKLLPLLLISILVVAVGTNLSWALGILGVFLLALFGNSVNLLDGMNGLAAGVMVIAFAALGVLLAGVAQYDYALISFLAIPALIGFLMHNFRGKIFMGDSGSLFLGFLGGLLLVRLLDLSTQSFVAGLVVMAIPLADTAYVIITRALTGRPLLSGDLNHTYNHLQQRVSNSKIVLAIFYAVAILLAIVGLWIAGG
jgi:UDP-GlcNAc:undecaprenyl-phosphate GlcNAc-1-phosphate transferase